MAKFVCLLVCLAVLVPAALSLNCYSCNSDKEAGCLKSANPSTATCSPAAATFKNICVYKHTVDKDKKVAINATCGLILTTAPLTSTSLNECTAIQGGPEVKECRLCDSNLCNSAPAFSTNYLSLLYLPILYFVTRLVAH